MTPLGNLYEVLERTRVECGIKGMSLAVMYRGEVIFADGFGQRNDQDPFTAETLMPIASLTKAFTSAAIGELVAEGKMDWDTTPVNKYLPEFAFKDPLLTSQLTLSDLLSHRTGMPNIDVAWFNNPTPRRELIQTLRNMSPSNKLLPYYNYSNVMYAVAGEASANVNQSTWEQVVQTKILDRLDLPNTGFNPQNMVKRSTNYALPYDAVSLQAAQCGQFERGALDKTVGAEAPAGDMFSNVLDLVKWGRVVMKAGELNGVQVLNKEALKECVTPHSIMLNKMGRGKDFAIAANYGFAWELDSYKGNNFYFHTGSIVGFRGSLAIYPDADIVVAFLTNTHKSSLRTYIPFYIVDQILRLKRTEDWLSVVAVRETQLEYDEADKSRRGVSLPSQIKGTFPSFGQDLESYVGQYSDPVMGTVTVSLVSDNKNNCQNQLKLDYGQITSILKHYHYDTFKFVLSEFGSEAMVLVTFVIGSNGQVSGLRFYLDEDEILEFNNLSRKKD
ncbi:hypothetical protein FBU30_001346 [Linnemannia zychae]|nr:hypothetical protein FBU30_001346 [Linnemannia zychae]